LKDYIRKKIKNHELLIGEKLPSLRTLQAETGISLGIIRQVIGDLASEGFLRMHQGRGVFVADPLSGPKNIALVLPCIGPEHITYIIKGIKGELSKVNASLVLYAAEDYSGEADIINMLDSTYVAGAIIYPPPTSTFANALKELNSRKVPIVLVDTLIKTTKLNSVTVNHRKMGFESMKHLLQHGHRNIGIIGLDSTIFSYRELLGGLRDATEQYDIDFDKLPKLMNDPMQMEPDNPWKKSEQTVASFIKQYPAVTALIGCNENITMGAFLGLKKIGKKIPEDISLIALGTLDCFKVSTPTISCVNQPYEEIGRLAAIHMLQLLNSNNSNNPVAMQLDPIFEERESVADISRKN
jgi:LacI family transcriptional regulator